MHINSNPSSLNASRSLQRSTLSVSVSLQRLSSGLRINSARDDAAGLAVSERLTAGVNGMNRAAKNINDGISLLQVADGASGEIVANFQRIRELAVQAANGTYSRADRQVLQREVNQLMAANHEMARQAEFNGLNLLDGTFSDQFQVGASAGQTIQLSIPSVFIENATEMRLVDVPLRQVSVRGAVAGALAAGDLSVNGTAIGAAVAGPAVGQSNFSAYAVAAAINSAAPAGIGASATTTAVGTAGGGAGIPNGGLVVNGVAIGPIIGLTATALAASAAAAIGAAAGASGVSATADGATLTLTAADGRDISIAEAGGAFAATLGLSAGLRRGSVTLSDVPSAESEPLVIGGNNPGVAGFGPGSTAPADTGGTISVLRPVGSGDAPVDISSIEATAGALAYIDSKIDSIGELRSLLGATENRLAMAYGHVQQGEQNLAAARSRIRDTDYAGETMELTRSQILQQAGTAMLAQANSKHQQVLLLLR